jgi:hypothetical protein
MKKIVKTSIIIFLLIIIALISAFLYVIFNPDGFKMIKGSGKYTNDEYSEEEYKCFGFVYTLSAPGMWTNYVCFGFLYGKKCFDVKILSASPPHIERTEINCE